MPPVDDDVDECAARNRRGETRKRKDNVTTRRPPLRVARCKSDGALCLPLDLSLVICPLWSSFLGAHRLWAWRANQLILSLVGTTVELAETGRTDE